MSAQFDRFVDQLTSSEQQLKDDCSRQLSEWKESLNSLYKDIESYLKPYTDSGRITVKYDDKQIAEEPFGLYTVKSATISIGLQSIRLDPIGTFLFSAKGRVDMVGSHKTAPLVLVDKKLSGPRAKAHTTIGDEKPPVSPAVTEWAWKIATPPPDIHYIDLDRDVFQDAMMSVVNA